MLDAGGKPTDGGLLGEILATLTSLPPEKQQEVRALVKEGARGKKWIPNPGPQTEAYYSEADCLLFGGEPGGGKSQLLLGLAFNEHQRSLIMRRKYSDLDQITEDAIKIAGTRVGFKGSAPPRLRLGPGRQINFRAAQLVGDERGTMGQGRDLLGIDEATHFAKSQIIFLMGWVRTETPGQRTRTVLATNPPLDPEGLWVIEMFAPWLDLRYPYPAQPGELRWVVSDEDGNDEWVDGPDDTREVRGKVMRPTSRTYIPSSVKDNPFYAATDYERTLDAMGEPHRSLLMGGFRTAFQDDEDQIIPTAWVTAAQARWTKEPPEGVPMCAMGVDCSGGGIDPMIIAPRYDGWFAELIEIPGKELPQDRLGTLAAGHVISHRLDNAKIIIDMGGGYGGAAYEHLMSNQIPCSAYKGASQSLARTADRQMLFTNKRTETLWRFREALDPDQGSHIALPPDPKVVADLTAPHFTRVPWKGGMAYKAESKEDVTNRLKRSTDRGDAIIMAHSDGERAAQRKGGFRRQAEFRHSGGGPRVVLGYGQQSRSSSGSGYRGRGEHG